MANKTIHCKLVTPAAALIDDQVSHAKVPLWDGLMGFLPGRAPILATLGKGELTLDYAGSAKPGTTRPASFKIEGGFVRMNGNELTILAEKATPNA